MEDLILTSFSVILSVIIVILFVIFGWYMVWKLIISKFNFIRELIKGAGDSAINDLKVTRSKIKKTRKD